MPPRVASVTFEGDIELNRSDNVSGRRTGRRIGRHHLAFIKGYFEGIDIVRLAERYLDIGRDRRKARDERRWILDALIMAARQRGDISAARLLKLPAGALPEDALDDAPHSLERFQEQIDPEGVYSETELLALYEQARARVPASRQSVRNARLRRRQRLLLDTLESSLVEPPRAAHRIHDWFDPTIAARLDAVGLDTLEALIHYINRYGYRWYRRVPRVGERTAGRVRDWLHRHADDIALPVDPRSALPRGEWPLALRDEHRHRAAEMAPIESFDPPRAALRTDRDALLRVLSAHTERPATYRAYRLQAERLLLWMSLVRETSLSQLKAADAAMFLRFASDPTPARQWCGPKAERGSSQWRPFERAMSSSGLALAQRILGSLCAALVKDGYLEVNPFRHLPVQPIVLYETEVRASPIQVAHSGSHALDDLCALPGEDPRSLRMRVVCSLLRDTGLSLQAMTRLRVRSLANWPRLEPATRGVAGATRNGIASGPPYTEHTGVMTTIRISAGTMAALDAYFRVRGVDPTQRCNDDVPLIARHVAPHFAGKEPDHSPVTPNVLARAITSFLDDIHRQRDGEAASRDSPVRLLATIPTISFRSLRRQARQRFRAAPASREERYGR